MNKNVESNANVKRERKPYREPKLNKRAMALSRYPEHVVDLALLVKNNTEIRRFTALSIINYLTQKGVIKGEKKFVSFYWNKFSVKCDGLIREFLYTEPFFLNALVSSFTSFSASAQIKINNFTKRELNTAIEDSIDGDEIKNMIESVDLESSEEIVDDVTEDTDKE